VLFDICLEWLDNNPPRPTTWEKFSNHFLIELQANPKVQEILLAINSKVGTLYLIDKKDLLSLAEEMLFSVIRAFSTNQQYPMIQVEVARRKPIIRYN
jgi:hypothetical protein